MPTQDFTSPGSTTWTAPFACNNVTATCIGGGGSGFKDTTDDDRGGGGGGGGFARSTRQVPAGTVVTVVVGAGGAQPGNQEGNDGGATYVSGGALSVSADGGGRGTDNSGGGGGGGASGDLTNRGQNGEDDDVGDDGGRGGGAGNQNGNSGRCSGNRAGGQGTDLDGSQGSCSGGAAGGTYGGGGGGNNGGEAGRGGNGAVRLTWDFLAPSISGFTATHIQPQGNIGVPTDDVRFSYSTSNASSCSIDQGVGSVATNGPVTIDSGLQSTAGSNSPISRTYTLTATGPGGTVTATATVSLQNDNSPSSCSSSSTTNEGPALNNLEPNTQYTVNCGPINGIDMVAAVTCNSAGLDARVGGGGYSSTIYITNGQTITFRFTSDAFNTDPSGQKTAARTYSYTVGTCSGSFQVQTRAPDVEETFDFGDGNNAFPFPDIDAVNNTPDQYVTSPTTITVDDVDILVELKVSNPNAEIRVKPQGSSSYGSWQTPRST